MLPMRVRWLLSFSAGLPALFAAACDQEPGPGPAASPGATSVSAVSPVPRTPVRFRALDGVRIEGSVFGTGRVGVVLGHGSDGSQQDWWNFAEMLAQNGYTALAINYRSYCPGGAAGCSGDGGTSDAWMDMLGGARYLEGRGVQGVVLMGSSMGGTASVVAAAQPQAENAGIIGVIALSGSVECCGMDAGKDAVDAIDVPMLFVAGRFDFGFAGSTRHWGRWAGSSGEAVIVASGEHGVDFFQLATPDIQRQVTELVMDLLGRVSATTENAIVGEWRRINSCSAFVRAFERVGLEDLAPEWLVTAGYFHRTEQIQATSPCAGATDDENSYFFEASGRFGSLDQDTVLVDEGEYRVVDDDTIAFVGPLTDRRVAVDFRIGQDDELRFDVVVPDGCGGSCRQDYAWVLSAFYPGGFERVS